MRSKTLHIAAEIIKEAWNASDRPVLVGIDGSDGSGKSYFAEELKDELMMVGIKSVIFSIDNFHNEKSIRYKKGNASPLGFYEDSYNLSSLVSELLEPIRDGEHSVKSGIFDCEFDRPLVKNTDISSVHVVLFEGLFLHRDELKDYWDLSVYLKTDFSVSVSRGNARFGLNPDPEHKSNARYVNGNRIYQERCHPLSRSGIVIDNNNLDRASIISNKYGQQTRTSLVP